MEAVDDWFADSLTEMYHKQHSILFRRYGDSKLGSKYLCTNVSLLNDIRYQINSR